MKKRLQNLLVKAFSLGLAFILVFPTNLFAMGLNKTKSKNYSATSSVMGLAADGSTNEEKVDQTLLATDVSTEETDKYIIEKYASLSKLAGQIDYKIIVKSKEEKIDGKITTTFAISKNTDLKDLKVEKVTQVHSDNSEEEIKSQECKPSILYTNDAFDTLAVTTEAADKAIVYHLSAKLTEEALAKIDSKSPQMPLEINIAEKGTNLYQDRYTLTINQSEQITGEEKTISQSLEEKEDDQSQTKAAYKEKSSTILGENKASITWIDYIHTKDDKEITYDIKLDENQEPSQIKIEYYGATETGYILKEDYTKTIPFAPSLKLQIPQGYIARIELKTTVKDGTNAKEYSINQNKIPNPIYKEEKAEESPDKKDDEDPLAKDSRGDDQSSKDLAEDKKDQSSSKESSDIDQSQSPIDLNKEAYLKEINADDKQKIAIDQIASALEAYNKEKSNAEELKASVEKTAKDQELTANTTNQIISALISGLKEEKHPVAKVNPDDLTKDIKDPTNKDENKLSDDQLKDLIKAEFDKKNAGTITEDDLESSLANIRDENSLDKEAFLNILADLYKNDEIATKNLKESDLPAIDRQRSKEEVLSEKLAEENLTREDFITFLKSYAKAYELTEDELKALLEENKDQVQKIIGDFTIDEIVAAAFLDDLNPQVFAGTNPSIIDADFSKESFITELEYYTETLTKATNEQKLFDIVKSNNPALSDQQIRSDYVGWKINIPGKDNSGNDITEIKKDKYEYDYMNFSIYAPAGQSLEDYRVVVEDGNGGRTNYSGSMTEKKGDHYVYSFPIPKAQLSEEGYNIYVVAKAPKKRQNYAIGLKITPDKNYVTEIADNYKEKFEELKKKYPLLIKWIDTSAANPYRNGIELLDTRMVYLEPKGWQDLFPYNEFRSVDYNDNVTDTDIIKNTVSMFGNITEEGQITWTISETFPAEKLVNKNTVGRDAYSAKSDGQSLGNPSVQILVPNGSGYYVTNLGDVDIDTLQNSIGSIPGTIVNYTYSQTATNKEELTTLKLDSGKTAAIAFKSVLEREPGDIVDTSGLKYLHKVQEHNDGPGYEVALSNDQANTMKAFIPKDQSANPRYNDPNFKDTGVLVFCLNPGKPEPTRQYKFNGTITKGEWSTAKKDWVQNGKAIASLATASEAKSSPLYKMNGRVVNDQFYSSLYEYVLRLYWYGQQMAEEYQLDEQSYYKIIQYNLYYWITGENYAENFRNMGGYNPNYFSSAEYSYATELKERIAAGKDWDKVNYDEEIQIFYYGHDKTRSYQNTITGDTKKKKIKTGSVTVNKIDQDGNKLPGAAFQLLGEDKNTVIKTLVTDANGVAVFENLEYGTYYIKEVQGPKGYQFTEEISKVTVGEKQAHVSFTAKNTKNEIEFRKVDENGRAMTGVVFELRQNGRPVAGQDQTSGRNGKFSWKELTPGNYQVVEKKVTDPLYSENEGRTVASFRVDENNIIQDKVIYYPNGSSTTDIKNKKNEGKPIGIEFTKVDLKTDNPLEGAEFVLEYRKTGSSIYRELAGSKRRSNSDGKLVWNDLEDGDYRVIETKAPDGEKYDTEQNLGEKATFTIEKNANGYYEITKVSPENKKITNTEKPEEPKEYFGEFEFTKVDSEDKKPLQGVEFTLTSDGQVGPTDNKFDYKVSKTTGADGKIAYTRLYPGTYTLTETKQLPGYQENTKTYKVVVANDGKTTIPDLETNKYELVFTDNDTDFRDIQFLADIKESLEPTNNPGEMLYKCIIKIKQKMDHVEFVGNRDSGLDSRFFQYNTRSLKDLAVGEEKIVTATLRIRNMDSITKDRFISPLESLHFYKVDSPNYVNVGSNPSFKLVEGSGSTTITNEKEKPEPAKLTIRKYDSATKMGLEGAVFELYESRTDAQNRNNVIAKATTNEHGYATFNSRDIELGETYYVREIEPPHGYKINGDGITEVKTSIYPNDVINKEIPNDKNNARFELYKKGSDGEYLKDVTFKLTKKGTPDSVELTTDGNGYISYDELETNTSYELEEVKSAEGYTLNNAKATITVDASGNVTVDTNDLAIAKEGENLGLVLVATNIKKPSIYFVKEDKASGTKLYGAEFVLYKDGTEVKNSLTSSDKEGKFGFNNLEDGSYTVYETVAPQGYPYLEEKLEVATFTVKDGKVTTLKTNQKFGETQKDNPDLSETYVIYNKINEIKFKKINKDKQALKGAKFKLDKVWDTYDENGEITSHRETVLEDIETLDDGIIALSATQPGRYQLIETQAPDGYQISKTGQLVAEFTVERGSLAIKNVLVGENYIQDMPENADPLEIVNKEVGKGKFQVYKVKKENFSGFIATSPLAGAKFLLKDVNSGQYVKADGTFTTNSAEALTESKIVDKNGSEDNGLVKYENLPVGEYELREFKSPDGYVRTINTWKVIVNDDGTTTISKKDEFDKGVEATITDETTTSPAKLQLVNKSNEIEFTKKDSKTGDPLVGVEFEIWWDQQGSEDSYKKYVKINNTDGSTTFTTDSQGKIKLTKLKPGHYKIYETKIPDGYFVADEDKPVDNEPIADATGEFVNEFFVDTDGDIKKKDHGIVGGDKEEPITTIKNTPYTGKFRVQKVGENGFDKLEGAVFELYKVTDGNADKDNPISSVEVKNNIGLVEFADLANGDYLLEETQAPKGYTISSTKWNINVKDGKVNITPTDGSADFTITDDIITLNVVNKRPSLPQTGGTGVKIAFALIGTAVMITAVAYFGIFANNNKRSRRA